MTNSCTNPIPMETIDPIGNGILLGVNHYYYYFFFFKKDPEDFILFNSVGYSLQQGYEAQRHVKSFEQIISVPIHTAGHPT